MSSTTNVATLFIPCISSELRRTIYSTAKSWKQKKSYKYKPQWLVIVWTNPAHTHTTITPVHQDQHQRPTNTQNYDTREVSAKIKLC